MYMHPVLTGCLTADDLVAVAGLSPLEVPAIEEAAQEWLQVIPPLVGAAARYARWGVVEALLEGGAVAVLASYMQYAPFSPTQRATAVQAVHTLLVATQRLWKPPQSLSMLLPATPGVCTVVVDCLLPGMQALMFVTHDMCTGGALQPPLLTSLRRACAAARVEQQPALFAATMQLLASACAADAGLADALLFPTQLEETPNDVVR